MQFIIPLFNPLAIHHVLLPFQLPISKTTALGFNFCAVSKRPHASSDVSHPSIFL
jgi:hypothetical protein